MKYTLICAAAILSACTTTGPVSHARLGSDPALAEGRYDTGGGITTAVDIRESNGNTMVCGVWSQSDDQASLTRGPKPEVLGSGSINLDGKALVRGLMFLNEVPSAQSYVGAPANCVVTDRDWREGDDARRPTVRFPHKELYLDADDVGSDMVRFGQVLPDSND